MLGLTLLPTTADLQIEHMKASQQYVTGLLESRSPSSACPLCGVASSNIQSQYTRTLADLPWAAIAVIFILQVRRFFCDNSSCKRKIFCERLPQIVQPYRRRTARMERALNVVAHAEGGESGARTARELGMGVSPDTMLRQIRRTAPATGTTPKVLGVDDFSFRRGQTYGTILIDLEKHERIDMLPDRNAESFANWLKEHPGIEIISRDRGQIYADGARAGAPDAKHVADRFHLMMNVREAVERLLNSHHQQLRAATEAIAAQSLSACTTPEINSIEPVTENSAVEVQKVMQDAVLPVDEGDEKKTVTWRERSKQLSADRRQRRLARFEEINELSQQGMSSRAIARHFGMSRRTVRKFLRADEFPERANSQRRSNLDPFIPYLKEQWEAGLRNSRKLWEKIREQGYRGSQSQVGHLLVKWRKELPLYLQSKQINKAKSQLIVPSPRQASFWLLGIANEKTAEKKVEHENFVAMLCNNCDEINNARELGIEFIEMIRNRQSAVLDSWLKRAQSSGLPDLKNFAFGVERDKEAVENALKMEWSNGQVEGNNHRLKMIKRQMYGRAKFDLLRARVLHST